MARAPARGRAAIGASAGGFLPTSRGPAPRCAAGPAPTRGPARPVIALVHVHVLLACGAGGEPRVPTEQLGSECASQCADFMRGSTYKRIRPLESEAEHSDEDPC